MLVARATGVILLLYSGFHMAIGLWVPEFPWLLTGVLLVVGAAALLACRPWSRVVVYAAALAAAGVGLIGQVDAASAARADIPLAVIIWSLWTSLWLAVAYLGGRYLPGPGPAPWDAAWARLPSGEGPAAGGRKEAAG
jgi:hypothetical protein